MVDRLTSLWAAVTLLVMVLTAPAGGEGPVTPSPGAGDSGGELKLLYEAQLSTRRGEYVLLWGYDEHTITFEVHVRTRGWVGFGLAPNRNMLGADLVIGWVDDAGKPHLHDRYSTNFSRPGLDPSQDYRLLAGSQNDTHTKLRFSRRHVTCDPRDNDVRNDTMGIIWAHHPRDPDSARTVHYHGRGRRGGRSLQLLTSSVSNKAAAPMPRDAFNIDFNMPNVLLPGRDTAYLCHAFPVPRLGRKHHVIQVEPILHDPHSGLVHHMILYGCYHDVDMTSVNTPTECYQHNISPMLMLCNAVFAGWAIGGEVFTLPEHTGLPLGDSHYPSMMMLQIHYDNSQGRADIRDSSGLRLWLTSYLREHDAAFIQTGVTVDGFQAIPPQADLFTTQGHCLPECLTEVMKHQEDGIQVFGALLHTHLAGVAVRVRHLRDGQELPPIVMDEHYDFNYQETRLLARNRQVLPGDHLITECTYASDNRMIWGGLSTRDEMCIAYLLYYPAIALTNCDSRPTTSTALSFLDVQLARNGVVIWPKSLKGKTYRDVLSSVDWDNSTRRSFQESVTSGQVLTSCKMGTTEYKANYKKRDLPKINTKWEPQKSDVCKARRRVDGHTSDGSMTSSNLRFVFVLVAFYIFTSLK